MIRFLIVFCFFFFLAAKAHGNQNKTENKFVYFLFCFDCRAPWLQKKMYFVSVVFLFSEILRYSRLEKYRLNMPTLRPKGWQVHKLIQLQGMTNPGDRV